MRVNYADKTKTPASTALGFEAQVWAAADKMRGHLDSADSTAATLLPKLPLGTPKISNLLKNA